MLMDWGQVDLAEACGLSKTAIANIEKETNRPSATNAEKIRDAFDRAGVEFIDGGVREKRDLVQVLEGDEGIRKFYNDVAETAETEGGFFLVYGVDEGVFVKAAEKIQINTIYRTRIKEAQEKHFVEVRVIVKDDDKNINAAPHCIYKKLPNEMVFTDAAFYIYGKKIALIVWKKEPKFIIISDHDLVTSYKNQFEFLWQYAEDVS